MTTDEKYTLTMYIIKEAEVENDRNIVISIAECVKNNRFFVEYNEGNIVLFLTWEDNLIENKRYIFVNNLWIDPAYRNKNTLIKIRFALKYLLSNVYKFYWHNRKKDKLIYRS